MPAPYVPLFQERWRRRPFWMLVACILVNRTRWEQARSVHGRLVAECADAVGLAKLPVPYLEEMLRPLGLSQKRAENLAAFAYHARFLGRVRDRGHFTIAFDHVTRRDVLGLPGCGKYAADSWSIFVEGRTFLKGVTDKRLRQYQSEMRRRSRTSKSQKEQRPC